MARKQPSAAVKAAREAYQAHNADCESCDRQTGAQCPRGASLWRIVAVAIRKDGGPRA